MRKKFLNTNLFLSKRSLSPGLTIIRSRKMFSQGIFRTLTSNKIPFMKEFAFQNNFLLKNFVDISSESPQFCKTSLCPTKMCRHCGIHISLTIVFCHIYLKLYHLSQTPSLNTQSCIKRPLCSTLKFENFRSPKKNRF